MIGKLVNVIHVRREGENREIHDTVDARLFFGNVSKQKTPV